MAPGVAAEAKRKVLPSVSINPKARGGDGGHRTKGPVVPGVSEARTRGQVTVSPSTGRQYWQGRVPGNGFWGLVHCFRLFFALFETLLNVGRSLETETVRNHSPWCTFHQFQVPKSPLFASSGTPLLVAWGSMAKIEGDHLSVPATTTSPVLWPLSLWLPQVGNPPRISLASSTLACLSPTQSKTHSLHVAPDLSLRV